MRITAENDGIDLQQARSARAAKREQKVEQRRRRRNNAMITVGVIAVACLVAGLIALLTMSGSGSKIPDVVGLTYNQAVKKVEGAGFTIEVDPDQDSSGECGGLKVENQDPKPGSSAEKEEMVTVRLKGLQDSPELTSNGNDTRPEESQQTQPEPSQPAAPAPAPAAGRSVCIDPGHSNRTGSEIDPATGLNVGDNGGASGELQSNWDLAQKVKARLEQAGFTVRLTKPSADSYASLRTRADIGNACAATVRLHYDDSGFTGVMRAPENGARCPSSDPSRITVIDTNVARESNRLAADLAASLGLSVRDDTGGTSQGNATPSGHPTALIGSVLSRVPVVCIENKMGLVRDNPTGQDQVAAQIAQGVSAYFQGR